MTEVIRAAAWLAIGVSAGVLTALAIYYGIAPVAEWAGRHLKAHAAPAIARGHRAARSVEDKLDMDWARTLRRMRRDDKPVYTPPARLPVRLPYLQSGSYAAAAGPWPLEVHHPDRRRPVSRPTVNPARAAHLVTLASGPQPAEDTAVDSTLIPQLRAMLDEAETTGAYLSRKFGGILGDLNRSLDELRRQYA